MPIDYEALIKQKELEQQNLLNAPADLSGTRDRVMGDRSLFAQRFGVEPQAAGLQTSKMDRSLGETLDKNLYQRQIGQLNKKWEAVYQQVLQATGDVKLATQYANQYLDQTTEMENVAKTNELARASKERKQNLGEQYGQSMTNMQNQYSDKMNAYDPNVAIASILSAGATVGAAKYTMRDKTPDSTSSGSTFINPSSTMKTPKSLDWRQY